MMKGRLLSKYVLLIFILLSVEVLAENEKVSNRAVSVDATGGRLLEFRKHSSINRSALLLTIRADVYENTSDQTVENDGLGGFSYRSRTSRVSNYGLGAGYRKYLAQSSFSYFIDTIIVLNYSRDEDIDNDSSLSPNFTVYEKGIDLDLLFGAEYHLSQNFSLEGRVGLGVGYTDVSGDGDGHSKGIGTTESGIMMNLYF